MGACCSFCCTRRNRNEGKRQSRNDLTGVAADDEKASLVSTSYQLHGSLDKITPVSPICVAPERPELTQTSEFRYLPDSIGYRKPPPDFNSVEELQQVFRKVYDKYEIVLVNRQKIDETLRNFKQALNVENGNAHVFVCFDAWKRFLTNPEFELKHENGKVLEITVVAMNDQAQHLQSAQRNINELLIACHTFLNQYSYMRAKIKDALEEARQVKDNIALYLESVSHLERMSITDRVPRFFEEYDRIPGLLTLFYEDVNTILREITDSAYILTQ